MEQRKNHTVYKKQHIVVAGDLAKGFTFYGPWVTDVAAKLWATKNLGVSVAWRLHEMERVKDQ